MASYNKVVLVGNLTRDIELRHVQSGAATCELGLAVNESWTDKSGQKREEATFVDVTLWGKTAEIAAQYLTKGSQVLIDGRLKLDQWEDKKTGEKRSKLKVVGEVMKMLGSKGGRDSTGERPQTEERSAPPSMRGANLVDPDDVPF